jgi:DNA-binding transcriptional ArsR family regulator
MEPRPKSAEIRRFIIDHVDEHSSEIASLTAERFGITRQSVHRHLDILIDDDVLDASGSTRSRKYKLNETEIVRTIDLRTNRDEDTVYRHQVEPHLLDLSKNVLDICHYAFTEMFNNAIDHSGGDQAIMSINRTAKSTSFTIKDNGIGIFEKVKQGMGLSDHREAFLELSKGKLTTDPKRHTGQGIFFTSRMCDRFLIHANNYFFGHKKAESDWFFQSDEQHVTGTRVIMSVENHTTRTTREVFDQFTNLDSGDLEFAKTHVPLKLSQYGADSLISRSAAKRVLARFEQFEEVLLDFTGVNSIGHSFADEIFRVFQLSNPSVEIRAVGANPEVLKEIARAERLARNEDTVKERQQDEPESK